MINGAERVGSTSENPQVSIKKHPLEDVPPFDPEAATKRIEEAKNNLFNKTEENNESIDDVCGSSGNEYDEYGEPDSASSLEKSKARIPKYEKILLNPDLLKTASQNYLEQYQPESK